MKSLSAVGNNLMVKMRKKRHLFRLYYKIMSFHYATRKIGPICKISTCFEDLSFLNPRSNLSLIFPMMFDIILIVRIICAINIMTNLSPITAANTCSVVRLYRRTHQWSLLTVLLYTAIRDINYENEERL